MTTCPSPDEAIAALIERRHNQTANARTRANQRFVDAARAEGLTEPSEVLARAAELRSERMRELALLSARNRRERRLQRLYGAAGVIDPRERPP